MTIVVQFETNNWHAEGVALMSPELYDDPIMQKALSEIAKKNGFDRHVEFERATPYDHYHRLADAAD